MGDPVTGQCASLRSAVVRDWRAAILANHVRVEVHHALAADIRRDRTHSMRRVANGTAETFLPHVQTVFRETRVGENLCQIMALCAQCIRSRHTQIRIREQIRHGAARGGRLAELIIALQNVRINGPMWAIRTGPAKLAIVVAIVAIGTEDTSSDSPR